MRISNGFHLLTVCLGGLVLAGCVMTEKYDAEKARSLNFQRLLAQEEKRTGELDSELKRVTRDAAEHEGRNRELEAQLKAVREQLAGIQEETDALREAAAAQPPLPLAAQKDETLMGEKGEVGSPLYHEVKPGETLFRLSRQHGVDVQQIKKWNSLTDDLIEVGQKLIVGHQ